MYNVKPKTNRMSAKSQVHTTGFMVCLHVKISSPIHATFELDHRYTSDALYEVIH